MPLETRFDFVPPCNAKLKLVFDGVSDFDIIEIERDERQAVWLRWHYQKKKADIPQGCPKMY